MQSYRYLMPTEILLQPHALDSLSEHCASLGARPMLVTGRHSARACGFIDRVRAQLPGAVVFDAIPENPGVDVCDEGGALCRKRGCDYLIGLGGGSPIDAAKAIAVLAQNGGSAARYFGHEQFPNGALPIVAIPTTAGTGSEVTPYAVLVDPKARAKRTITGRALFPRLALLDPELSRTMPAEVTASTGLDALSQAMEGLLSKKATLFGDALAFECCRLVKRHLGTAVREPANIDARAGMLHAAMLSGCVIAQSGTTLVHGMGYYFTLEFGIPHGLANGLLLAPVFRVNAAHEAAKVATLAQSLGFPCEASGAAEAITRAIHRLFAEAGLSPAARDHGALLDRLRWCAEDIHQDSYRFKNQVGEFSAGDLHALFVEAYEGRP